MPRQRPNGTFSSTYAISSRGQEMRRRATLIHRIAIVTIILIVLGGIFMATIFRFDWAAGSHRIWPTAIDTDFWGNYQVYFRTSIITANSEEDFYYISKGDERLADAVREAIRTNQEIVVHYDRWIGFKGFTAPRSSPIVRIEFIDES